jgi:hypothetical protein
MGPGQDESRNIHQGGLMVFLDSEKTIATCVAETCDGCDVQNRIHCHFKLKDLIHFLLIA